MEREMVPTVRSLRPTGRVLQHDETVRAGGAAVPKKRSQWRDIWVRLRRNKMAMAGLALLMVFVFFAVFADLLYDYSSVVIKKDVPNRLQGPSAEHWFGTDELGRDVLARIVHGTRISMLVGLVSVSFSLAIGGPLGAIAGYYGGKLGEVIMRLSDILSALPNIMLALTIVTAFGQNLLNLMIAVGIATIPGYIRIIRASVITIKGVEYVEAARAIGARDWQIMLFHIIPNCMAPIIVQATLRVASAILSIASLSFLGLGIKPPTPEWGLMLSAGRNYLRDAWHLTFFPGLAIMLAVLSLNLLGDGLRDALDPKLKK